jgi:hypothetical protein
MTTASCAFRFSSVPIGLSLASLFFGCSSAPVSPDGRTGTTQSAEETEAANETGQKLLYTIPIEDGHTIGLYELAAGVALVTETAQMGQAPVLAKVRASGAKSFTEVYRLFHPEDDAPPVIVAADARLAAFTSQPPVVGVPVVGASPPASTPAPASAPARAGAEPRFYTASQQTWFAQTFCVNSSTLTLYRCEQGFDSVTTGWQPQREIYTTAFNGSEDTGNAAYTLAYWTGGAVGSGTFGRWLGQLPPGYYQSAYDLNLNGYIWIADLEVTSGAAYLDIAALGCGEPGEDSCVANCGSGGCAFGCSFPAAGFPNGMCTVPM